MNVSPGPGTVQPVSTEGLPPLEAVPRPFGSLSSALGVTVPLAIVPAQLWPEVRRPAASRSHGSGLAVAPPWLERSGREGPAGAGPGRKAREQAGAACLEGLEEPDAHPAASWVPEPTLPRSEASARLAPPSASPRRGTPHALSVVWGELQHRLLLQLHPVIPPSYSLLSRWQFCSVILLVAACA